MSIKDLFEKKYGEKTASAPAAAPVPVAQHVRSFVDGKVAFAAFHDELDKINQKRVEALKAGK